METNTQAEKQSVKYSPDSDALYIRLLPDANIDQSAEAGPGIIVDLDKKGQAVGVEILDFMKRLDGSVDENLASKEPDRLPSIHPGEVLRIEFLRPLGITPYRFAQETGLSMLHVSELIWGMRNVTAAIALKLAAYLDTSPQFWLNLQNRYDLEEARDKMGDQIAAIRPVPRPDSSPPLSLAREGARG